jgi:hypothetical protein
MQLLGLFTTIYPLQRRSTKAAWLWAIAFSIVGSICSIGAVPLYLYVPVMWSALVSFFGSAAQALVALQLALLAETIEMKPFKED